MLVILVNGAPGAGKDTVSDMLADRWNGRKFKFASPLKKGVHASLGLMVPEDNYESVKDLPHRDFHGKSPRQAYIEHSEKYMKPMYGQDIFAKILFYTLQHHKRGLKVAVVSDCGFQVEVDEIIKRFDCIVIQVHREGHTFKNDSREYIEHPDIARNYKLENNGTIHNLAETVYQNKTFTRWVADYRHDAVFK